jgi:hypothetical protein
MRTPRSRFLVAIGIFVSHTLGVPSLTAQPAVRVQGTAFDSLRGEPMRSAMVAILGLTSSAVTDERGRFSFDRVPLGRHTFVVQHPALDSIGFSGLSREVTVATRSDEVHIVIPSFATLWRTACGSTTPPADSGLVFGTIRDTESGRPVADAFVDLTWVDVSYDKTRGVRQRAHRGETRSDSTGGYIVCGVPVATWLRIDAGMPNGTSGRIDLPPAALQVRRRDLLLGPTVDAESSQRGTITGHLVGPDGGAFLNARVVLDDSSEVRSGPDGRFTLQNVRVGTRQVEVFAIGIAPVVAAVDVMPGQTATLAIPLRRVTTLDVIQVTAPGRGRRIAMEIIDRKREGFGHTMELGELVAHATMETVFSDFPSTTIERGPGDFIVWLSDGRGARCRAQVWIDGARSDFAAVNMLRPREVTAVELFTRAGAAPMKYRPVEVKSSCGVILVWTNWAFGK